MKSVASGALRAEGSSIESVVRSPPAACTEVGFDGPLLDGETPDGRR